MKMKNLSPDHNERDSKSRKRKWQASDRSRNGARTEYCIYRLWATGLTSSGYFPSSVKLESVSSETFEREKQEKQWVLVCHSPLRDDRETSVNPTRFLWLPVAEKIQKDLHTCLQNWMNNMKSQKAGVGKPSFVARIGKVYFHGTAMNLNTIQASLDAETSSRKKVKKTFYTNVSDAYMEAAERLVVPETGFESESRKEYYHIKVLDKLGSTISCKCFPTKGGKLQLNKVESSTVRHLIADILCLGKDFDLRLMLATRETFGKLPDDADQAIRELIKSAIVDPTALGGLRWPTGMESFGGFSVSAVWHTKFAVFKSPTMTMKLRDADRFDFASSTVEVSKEVLVKMTGITRQLQDGIVESKAISKMLHETLEFIWSNLLNRNCSSSCT